jgi:hypothetical protein
MGVLCYLLFLGTTVQILVQKESQVTNITELDEIISALKAAGIHEHSIFDGKIGQSHQIRRSLYTEEGEFVAFFCQYEIPANALRKRLGKVSNTHSTATGTKLSEQQNNLIKKWFVALTAQYPPT